MGESTDTHGRSEGEERFRTLYEHAPVMIDSFDDNGKLVLWNRECERRLGYTREELNANDDPLALCFPDPAERERVEANVQRADGRFREYRVRAKDGSERIQIWADFRLPTGALISVGHDITEERTLEEQLRRAQKLDALGRVTGGIAHDFNNLLTVVLGNLPRIIKALPPEADEARECARTVEDAARQGARLVRRLLAFGRHDHPSLEATDLAKALEEEVSDLRRVLPETLALELEVEPGLPAGLVDRDALTQMLLNLATNARDATGGRGTLRLQLRAAEVDERGAGPEHELEPEPHALLVVEDDGPGMSSEVRERLFEPFFTTKPPGEGSGLGMPMVYGLVRQMRGWVDVHSEPGAGTRVELWLPFAPRAAADPRASGPSSHPPGRGETILVVEDEPAVRNSVAMALRDHGYEVTTAADGREALAILSREAARFALVLCDVVMPNMTGPELVRRARALERCPPFVLTSGYAGRAASSEGELDPSVPVLAKPWTLDELLTSIRRALRTGS